MTFDDAFVELGDRYPGVYVSLQYEKIRSSHGDINTQIKCYVAGIGWGLDCNNFRTALDSFEKKEDINAGIADKEKDNENT